jgi:hypothetical protein
MIWVKRALCRGGATPSVIRPQMVCVRYRPRQPRASPVWQILHDHAAKVPGLSADAADAIAAFLDCEVFAPRENLTTSCSPTRRSEPEKNSRLDREPGGALPAGVVRFAHYPPSAPTGRHAGACSWPTTTQARRSGPLRASNAAFSRWGTKGAALVLPPSLPQTPTRPNPLKIQFPTNNFADESHAA